MIASVKGFLTQHKKYAPVAFFVGGFIWDSLTLGRVDSLYSNFILFTYLGCLTLCIYIFNMADDGKWEGTFLEPYQEYAPLAIQFFLGGLSSAYVIFFFQSVTLTKTMVFFVILVVLLFSNELLKHRISNKYLQFGAYYFVTFTFFIFILPIIFGAMNTFLFILSGFASLGSTLYLIKYIYANSPSTRKEVSLWKLWVLIVGIYAFVNTCYYFNLIPPVPLSLENGLVAYDVQKEDNTFEVSYERVPLLNVFKSFDDTFNYTDGDTVYVFTSIFAPSDLKKSVLHNWQWYNAQSDSWSITDRIGFEVTGGREGGFRGYTYKANVWPGKWRVNVITDEGLVLGRIDFQIIEDSLSAVDLNTRNF